MSVAPYDTPPDEATIAAYLANSLDPLRAEAFETYCLKNPEFARRIEADLLLRAGMKQTTASVRSDASAPAGRGRRQYLLAIAAGVVLLVVGGLLLLPRLQAGSLVAYRLASDVPPQLLAGPRVSITLLQLRGASDVRRISPPRDAGALAVRMAVDGPPGPQGFTVKVAVDSKIMPPSVTLQGLQADGDGYVVLYLPVAQVAGQRLKITVASSAPGATDPLTFRVQVAYAESTPAPGP